MRRGLLLAALGAALAAPAAAQEPPAWRLAVSGALALARRQGEPWQSIHTSLRPSGWDSFYNTGSCFFSCVAGASDVAVGYPVALTASVRARVAGAWQLRALVSHAPVGSYPGRNGATTLFVTPSSDMLGVQAAVTWRALWFAAGPGVFFGRVNEVAGPARRQVKGTRAGLATGVGITTPRRSRWYLEVSWEPRWAGSLDVPALAVPGAPSVPAMRVPLTHALLAAGVGWRR